MVLLSRSYAVGYPLTFNNPSKLKSRFRDAQPPFFLTCVYGDPVKAARQQVWDTITEFGHIKADNWIYLWDFNSYLAWHEKKGGNRKNFKDISQFQTMLDRCQLLDIGAHGPTYTWNNHRAGRDNIIIRLDRVLANQAWRNAYLEAIVTVQGSTGSDHLPLCLDSEGGRSSGMRPFRFDSMWFTHLDCQNAATKAWTIPMVSVATRKLKMKTENCKVVFREWNRDIFGNVHRKIESLLHELQRIQRDPSPDNQQRELEIHQLLEIEYNREELMW
ncbi:uncharacterized protein LOC122664514 [Telopea speciosissima]|uniref:uncharacterized protein LOC122664514 n=1 Tax=Telopea speciosissima TaxID=54955 RepID=UPI001CC778F7|nr:uncharacterized protein LOC122664514 [Telopea speciosissima]